MQFPFFFFFFSFHTLQPDFIDKLWEILLWWTLLMNRSMNTLSLEVPFHGGKSQCHLVLQAGVHAYYNQTYRCFGNFNGPNWEFGQILVFESLLQTQFLAWNRVFCLQTRLHIKEAFRFHSLELECLIWSWGT